MILDKIVSNLKKKNIDSYEVLQKKIKKITVEVFKGKPENFKESEENQIAIRILKNKKIGFTYISNRDLSDEMIDKTIENMITFANFTDSDEFYSFSKDSKTFVQSSINSDILSLTVEKMIELSCRIEEASYGYDKRIKNVKNAGVTKGEIEVKFINSAGGEKFYKSNFIGASVVTVAQDGNESYMGYENYISRKFDLSVDNIGINASKKAVRLFGSTKGKSMKCPVIIENEMVADLFSLISTSFFMENIDKKKSLFFQNSYGDVIANKCITLIDDGTIKDFNGTAPFDDEGIKTTKTYLIQDGTLKNFLNNNYYATKYKQKNTGNGFKPSFKAQPSISITNLILSPGEREIEKGIKDISHGLYIVNLMGLHTANPITGDFSLGAEAILIENGELTTPVKEIVLTGNLKSLLLNIKEIYNDVKSVGVIYTPSVFVEQMEVSGS